jgi:hypothetical protein
MPLLFTGNYNGQAVSEQRISADQLAELIGAKRELDEYRRSGKKVEFRLLPEFVQDETPERSFSHIKLLKMPTQANCLINGAPTQIKIYTGIRNMPNSLVPEYRYQQSNKVEVNFAAGPAMLLDPVTDYELIVFMLASPMVQTPYVQFSGTKSPRLFWFKRDEYIRNQIKLKEKIGNVRAEMLSASPLRKRLFIQGINVLMKRGYVIQDDTDVMFAIDHIQENAADFIEAWNETKTFYVGAIAEAFNRGILEVHGPIGSQSVRYRANGNTVCELGWGENYHNALWDLMQEKSNYAETLFAWTGITEEEIKGIATKPTKGATDSTPKKEKEKDANNGETPTMASIKALIEDGLLKIHGNGIVASRKDPMEQWVAINDFKVKVPLSEADAVKVLDKLGK